MIYFINTSLIIKNTKRGLGVFTTNEIQANTIIEHSPFSSCWESNWSDTPDGLRQIVFSFPKSSDNYVIALGYISIYNHSDNNNADWFTTENGILIRSTRDIKIGEEVFINYGDAYWSGGWSKY